ncbi:MAG: hypothetical protein MST00_05650 [Tenericutes bacterium]|nr:hypothetical protein [Mycoplasmatota bacterium]
MQCLDRKTIDIVDDYLSELVLPKDISKSEIVTEINVHLKMEKSNK